MNQSHDSLFKMFNGRNFRHHILIKVTPLRNITKWTTAQLQSSTDNDRFLFPGRRPSTVKFVNV